MRTTSMPNAVLADAAEAEPADTVERGFITRRTLRDALGVEDSVLRSLEQRGLLRGAKKNKRGWVLYAEDTIPRMREHLITLNAEPTKNGPAKMLPASREPLVAFTAEEAGAVFERIEQGKSLVQVFMETRLHPAVIHAIARDHERFSGSIFVPKDLLKKMNKLRLPSLPVVTANDLFDVLEEMAQEIFADRHCTACKQRPRAECRRCARAIVINELKAQNVSTAPQVRQPPPAHAASPVAGRDRDG